MVRRAQSASVVVWWLGAWWLAGCGADPVSLSVDVISDWEPGIDFVAVETEVSKRPFEGADSGEIRQATLRVTGTESFLEGVRVADLDDVGTGRTFARISLRDAAGRAIASRVLDVVLDRSFAATVLLTRSCRDVECPAPAGAPELSECQGGECVDPRCSPSTPEYCPPPRCDGDADCADELPTCGGERVCRRAYCLCRESMLPPDAGFDGGRDGGFDGGPACPTLDCANPACDGMPCDDGDACSTGEVCGSGACSGGTNVACDDGNACTDDACDPATGCVFTNNAAPCDDGNACTTGDACSGGACAGGGSVSCNDGNACTNDSCNPASGCVFANNTASCNDGNPCTSGDRCSGGSCRGGGNAANGTSCGGAGVVCCGGSCVNTNGNASHCGGCGVNCGAIGRTCAATGTGGYSCRGCTTNAECQSILNGSATCYDLPNPPTFCQCQCPSDGVCSGAGCGAGMFCHDCPGHNFCSPTGGGC